jgi:crossover junction endodeoxyribonuclease RuvC
VIVLGVDPSSVATGWAILAGDSRRARAVDFGVLRPATRLELPKRLAHIHDGLVEIVTAHRPEILVIESAFLHRNVKTAFALGQVRGVVLLVAVRAGIPIAEYTAPEIKRAAVGYGAADKKQVVTMMTRILGLTREPSDDEADALATAWCHVTRNVRPVTTGGKR